jgi:hypothetical protein
MDVAELFAGFPFLDFSNEVQYAQRRERTTSDTD